MRILFTAGGSPGNEAIYRKLTPLHNFWFADSDLDRMSSVIPDERKFLVPLVSDKNYYKKILAICIEKEIQILVPGIDEELLEMHKVFALIKKTSLFLPSQLFIKNMLDKYSSMNTLDKFNFPVPRTMRLHNANELDQYPLILKPRFGRGSRGIQVVTTAKELELFVELKKINNEDYICQSFKKGEEYTVQILNHKNMREPIIVPLKVLLKKGVTLTAEIDFDKDIIDLCLEVAKKFKENKIFNIQLIKCKDDNSINIFEINPRFSTTTCILPYIGIDPFKLDVNQYQQSDLRIYQGLKLNRNFTNDVR
ncbi:ATP-grasp domain-containing protein [Pseudomonadota bacterium]|nr:ATP-grasp domain-containing protein [Pseudomonadota bacterium]